MTASDYAFPPCDGCGRPLARLSRKPFPQTFWVRDGLLCAGCYPGDVDPVARDRKLTGLLDCGMRCVINLMEAGETGHDGRPFAPYLPRLRELADERGLRVEGLRLPLQDVRAPSRSQMARILGTLGERLAQRIPTYLHCWGGHGRTSTVVACYLIEQGLSPRQAIARIEHWRAGLPKHHYPFEGEQERFVRSWAGHEQTAGPS